jgi:hypothetical protein
MKIVSITIALVVLISVQPTVAQDIRIVNITFPGPIKPKTQVDRARNWYTNHFTVSASYKIQVELRASIPPNTYFNVGTYALVGGRLLRLGAVRVGRVSHSDIIYATYHIFPSSANYYGQCQFVVIADYDNEIKETDETPLSNEWRFQATIHPPGSSF